MVENGLFKIKPEATHVMQHAEYGFTVNLPLEVVLQENFLLATHFNGEPISPDHGYPLRGVVGHIPSQKEPRNALFMEGCEVAALSRIHAA
jgi:DMSO/TMAO reductase YedYZ molybdopterin-dependent catalytic subunit